MEGITMLRESSYTEFAERNRAIKRELDPLLTIRETRDVLRVSANHVIRLVRQGQLEACDVGGNRIPGEWVDVRTNGIRISPESLKAFIDDNNI
jgi:hypothetical protein